MSPSLFSWIQKMTRNHSSLSPITQVMSHDSSPQKPRAVRVRPPPWVVVSLVVSLRATFVSLGCPGDLSKVVKWWVIQNMRYIYNGIQNMRYMFFPITLPPMIGLKTARKFRRPLSLAAIGESDFWYGLFLQPRRLLWPPNSLGGQI